MMIHLEFVLWTFSLIGNTLRSTIQGSIPRGVRTIAMFSFLAGFWFLSAGHSILTSDSSSSYNPNQSHLAL